MYKVQLLFYYFFNHIIGYDIGNALCNLVRSKIDLNQFDIIISENGVRLGKSLKSHFQGKLILHLHNDWLNINTKYAYMYKQSYDEIWTISDFLKKRVDAIEGDTQVRVLYNGVDTKLFEPTKKNLRKVIRERYGFDKDDLVIANCCRIVEEKGVLQTIKVFNSIKSIYRKHNLKLLIIGDISNETEYVRAVKKNANTDVVFTGYIDHNELPSIMGCADLGIASTIHFDSKFSHTGYNGVIECFNLTLVEFLALGIPVIATNSGGMPEILREEFKEFIVDAQESKFVDSSSRVLLDILEKINKDNLEEKCLKTAALFSKDNYLKQFSNHLMEL